MKILRIRYFTHPFFIVFWYYPLHLLSSCLIHGHLSSFALVHLLHCTRDFKAWDVLLGVYQLLFLLEWNFFQFVFRVAWWIVFQLWISFGSLLFFHKFHNVSVCLGIWIFFDNQKFSILRSNCLVVCFVG